jgi:multiple sugar transport system permease protein
VLVVSIDRRETRRLGVGLLFISPWLLGFSAFVVYPMVASLYYSFTRYDVISTPHFVGLENYATLFASDDLFRISLGVTLYFVMIGVPVGFVVAFLAASLLNQQLIGRSLFRTIFFLPAVTPAVATAMVWLWVYDPSFGLINSLLISAHMRAVPWLTSPGLAKPSIIIIQAWAQGSSILIFLAALQGVPRALYEAATVDGAGPWHRFWHVTVPMCTPAMVFVLITGLIGTFQSFTLPWLLTGGGPDNSTLLYGVYLYENAFKYFKMGYASAMAWILFVIIIIFTLGLLRSSSRWTFYGE